MLRFLSSILILMFAQSCTTYCIEYGYLDFSKNKGISVKSYYNPEHSDGMLGVSDFPSSYELLMENGLVFINAITERGYPTVAISAETAEGIPLNVEVIGGDSCLRVVDSVFDGVGEVMWITDAKGCKSKYDLLLKLSNSKQEQVDSQDLHVLLRKNGRRCQIDAI